MKVISQIPEDANASIEAAGWNMLSTFIPANSIREAKDQIVKLFSSCLDCSDVIIELIPEGQEVIDLPGDERNVRTADLQKAGALFCQVDTACILLLKISKRFNGTIRWDSRISQSEGLEAELEAKRRALAMAGAARYILNSGIIADERAELVVHGERVIESLEQSQKYFKFIYENTPLPYQTLDAKEVIIEVNKAWLDALGYKEEEVIGTPFNTFLAAEQEEKFSQCVEQLRQSGEIQNLELEIIKKDATSILIQLVGMVAKDKDGKVFNSHFIFQDVSGQDKIRELILQSERLATIAGLAAGIAHELNTPLSGIMQSVQLIEMFLDPRNETNTSLAHECGVDLNKLKTYLQKQDLDYFIDGIRGSALRASRIIRSLLDFSRPTDAKFEIVRLPELVDLVISLIQTDYDLKKKYDVINTKLETTYNPEVPLIRCVPMEVEQVILNLVKNSVHALGNSRTPEPTVRIRTSKRGDFARIEVEDNGPGISTEVRKHAFDPFFTTKSAGEGTGLGLAVSYTFVVEKHKGRIWIDSSYAEGTRVIVELPLGLDDISRDDSES